MEQTCWVAIWQTHTCNFISFFSSFKAATLCWFGVCCVLLVNRKQLFGTFCAARSHLRHSRPYSFYLSPFPSSPPSDVGSWKQEADMWGVWICGRLTDLVLFSVIFNVVRKPFLSLSCCLSSHSYLVFFLICYFDSSGRYKGKINKKDNGMCCPEFSLTTGIKQKNRINNIKTNFVGKRPWPAFSPLLFWPQFSETCRKKS